jgi:colicin import membrane protein
VARQIEEQRVKNLARMAGMAGASGAPSAQGSAQQSSGPSASYAGRIRARIKPNIVFTKDITGNPTAEVEVRTSPDGTIVGRKLLKSSGVTAWDEAVLQAIDKTEVLPRDIDGRVPAVLEISFRPKD